MDSAGKNDPHGDSGRALDKAQKQIDELKKALGTATGKEAKEIKKKIENIRKTAEKNKKGETHHRK